jgi:hypothetical protein
MIATGSAWIQPRYYTNLATNLNLLLNPNGGNVGIGLTSPGATLDVSGTARFMKNFHGSYPTFGSGVGTGGLLIGWNGQSDTHGETDFINFPGSGTGGFNFVFANSGGTVTSTPVVINPSGNVGIGTTAPSATLDVESASTDATIMTLGNSSGTHQYQLAVTGSAHSYGSGYLTFWDQTVGATRMIVSPAGNVGIGLTSPTAKLQVTGQIVTTLPSSLTPTTTAQTIDWSSGNIQVLSLASATSNVTLTFTNAVAGAALAIKVVQGATPYNIVWPSSVKWPNGTAPTISTTSDAMDLITFFYDGTYYFGAAGQNYK